MLEAFTCLPLPAFAMASPAEPDRSEAILLEQAIAGESRALEELLVSHHARLRRHIDQKMSPALQAKLSVDDILQLTYLQAYKSIGRFDPKGPGAFYGWLRTIAGNKLIDASRQRGREHLSPTGGATSRSGSGFASLMGGLACSDAGPRTEAMTDELRGAFEVALANLPENYRGVVKLRYLDGLPLEEVAKQLGVTTGAVRGLCHRARQSLRDQILRLSHYL